VRDIGSSGARSAPRSSGVVEEHAHPFGCVHLAEQSVAQLLPQAHSQIMQHPVEPSLQLTRSAVSAAGNNQMANDQSKRYRALTREL
jgi:hypothetical protein